MQTDIAANTPPARDERNSSTIKTLDASDPAVVYQQRIIHFRALRDAYNTRRYRAANLSVVLFLGAILIGLVGVYNIWTGSHTLAWSLLGLAVALLVAFIFPFRRQGVLDQEHRRYVELVKANEEGLARLARDWNTLPLRQPAGAGDDSALDSALADDLDLLGHASLQHLLNTATTPPSQVRLRGWLLTPSAPKVIRQRQAAVAELAPMTNFRDEITLFGRLSAMTQSAYNGFLQWAEQAPWLADRRWLIWVSWLSPALLILSAAAEILGLTAYPYWLFFVAFNWILVGSVGKQVEELLDQVADRQAVFQPYAGVFAHVEEQSYTAPLLKRIQTDLMTGDVNADAELRRLGRIMQFGDVRLSMIGPVIQIGLLWNIHTLRMLEDWQRKAGRYTRQWLETLSEMEALSALATLAFDNPDWAFPEIYEPTTARPAQLTAEALGHPLLPPDLCVANDVQVGPPGTFLLVTGSNMSGKSTLLRAIGVNITLAQAGGPVCARHMTLPPLKLATSVRVQDSLEYGVSYFMAELRRLKDVVDSAEATSTEGRTPFFLLDEILHGTNTNERQIAARRIIRHLLTLGATGVVSTHDLALGEAAEIAAVSTRAHFTESFTRGPDGPAMSFDYTLRPGLATSTNALKLMEIVGLPVDE
ncbi:MAG: hypothetical protein ABI068_12720 [Ktedonobacterales bacterium]